MRESLHNFVRAFWHVVEPAFPFKDNWHIGAVCEFLEAWYAREFHHGVINLPPGTGKSLCVDVFFGAWVWSIEPGRRSLHMAFDQSLTLRDARNVLQIVQSDLYRRCWPGTRMRSNVQAAGEMRTDMGGLRFGTTPGGKGMGSHFQDVSINDPVKPQDVLDGKLGDVKAGLEVAQRWIDGTMPTRRADPAKFGTMHTMQRLLERDPAGIALQDGKHEHLCLPMTYFPREQATWIIGEWTWKLDPRTQPGELLHPERYPAPVVEEMRAALGEHAPAQLDQNPIPRTGGLLEESHLRFEWVESPKGGPQLTPGSQGYYVQVWDFAAKGTTEAHSAVSGSVFCHGAVDVVNELANTIAERERGAQPVKVLRQVAAEHRFLEVDDVWGIFDGPQSEDLFERMQGQPLWSKAATIIVEEKAAGIGIIQRFKRRYPKLVAFHEVNEDCKALAQADKLDRHRANIGEYHAARVLLRPWHATIKDKIDKSDGRGPDATRKELLAFPRGARDDRVDKFSMALARLCQGQVTRWQLLRKLVESPPDV